MAKIGVTVYTFKIAGRISYDLSNISGRGSFVDIAYHYFEKMMKMYVNDVEQEKLFRSDYLYLSDAMVGSQVAFKLLSGTIKSGSYGLESEIVNTGNGKVEFQKHEKHADVMPFHFLIGVVPGKDTGIIMVQTVGVYGVSTILKEELQKLIKPFIPNDSRLVTYNAAPHEYFSRLFEEGNLQKIRLFKYKELNDPTDTLGLFSFDSEYKEEIFHAPAMFSKDLKHKFVEGFKNRYNVNDFIGIEGADYDNIKLEFKLGSSMKTVNYNGFSNITITEDITDDVECVGGHPTFQSTNSAMFALCAFYLKSIHVLAPVLIEQLDNVKIALVDGNVLAKKGDEEGLYVVTT